MADHAKTSKTHMSVDILRPWSKIDPKVIAGFASSVTVGGIVTAANFAGWDIPVPVASAIVILVYGLTAYWTKTRIPVADDSGLTARQTVIAEHAVNVGVDMADSDFYAAAQGAFEAAGIALDKDGSVTDTEHPLVKGE